MTLRSLLVGLLLVAGVAFLAASASNASAADKATQDFGVEVTVSSQDDGASDAESRRVDVQVWTVVAAVGAAAVGLLALLLRVAMGWVKPPPAPDESHH